MTKGFTLVELVIVIVIVAILSIVAVVFYQLYVEKAYLSDAISASRLILDAETHYALEHGKYTINITDLGIEIDSHGTYGNGQYHNFASKYFSYSCCAWVINGKTYFSTQINRQNKHYYGIYYFLPAKQVGNDYVPRIKDKNDYDFLFSIDKSTTEIQKAAVRSYLKRFGKVYERTN